MNKWLVAEYKSNEVAKLKLNLENQKFKFFLPKLTRLNSKNVAKEELMFPGYIFISSSYERYTRLKYTKGIKKILIFGHNIPYMNDDEIEALKDIENQSKDVPMKYNFKVGQEVMINKGSLKGNLANICSLPAKKRVFILIHILGSYRKINISLKNLSV